MRSIAAISALAGAIRTDTSQWLHWMSASCVSAQKMSIAVTMRPTGCRSSWSRRSADWFNCINELSDRHQVRHACVSTCTWHCTRMCSNVVTVCQHRICCGTLVVMTLYDEKLHTCTCLYMQCYYTKCTPVNCGNVLCVICRSWWVVTCESGTISAN